MSGVRVWQYRQDQSPLNRLCGASLDRVYGADVCAFDATSFFTFSGLARPQTFDAWPRRQQTAYVRAWLLAYHGGVFIDDSVIVFRRLSVVERLLDVSAFVGYSQYYVEPLWRTDIMACAKGAAAASAVWADVSRRAAGAPKAGAWLDMDRAVVTETLATGTYDALRANGYYWRPLRDGAGHLLTSNVDAGTLARLHLRELEGFALLDLLPPCALTLDERGLCDPAMLLGQLIMRGLGGPQ